MFEIVYKTICFYGKTTCKIQCVSHGMPGQRPFSPQPGDGLNSPLSLAIHRHLLSKRLEKTMVNDGRAIRAYGMPALGQSERLCGFDRNQCNQ